jgi:hypothetical protein
MKSTEKAIYDAGINDIISVIFYSSNSRVIL